MWLSLIIILLLFAVAYFQSTQGLFSALIMTVLTICCAAASLGTYEWVANQWLASLWKPDFAYPIALAAVFGVPLVILRLAADKLVRRACLLPSWLDRIGGGFCGLVTAFTLVGMIAFALQQIPFGGSVLSFERVPRVPPPSARSGDVLPPEADASERNLWLNPDRFVVGLGSVLSAGIFSGERALGVDDSPDVVQGLGWVNSAPAMVSRYVAPKSISIVRTEVVPFVYSVKPPPPRSNSPPEYEALPPKSGRELHLYRVSLKDGARDERKSHLFTLRQFRLVGQQGGKGALKQYHAIALQQEDASQTVNRHVRNKDVQGKVWPVVDDPYEPREDNRGEVEVVFELPSGFVPVYMEYKHGARVKVIAAASRTQAPSPSESTSTPERTAASNTAPTPAETSETSERPSRRRRSRGSSSDSDTVANSGRGGNVRGLTTQAGQSFFGNALPLEVKNYTQVNNVDVTRGKLSNGHLHAFTDEQEGRRRRGSFTEFNVPADKRLLQLNTGRLQARSGLGQALDFAQRTVQNYIIEDANGRQYRVIGKYAIADVDGRRVFEVQYFPEQAGSIGGLGAFSKIRETELKGDYEYVLLFLIEPGATVTSFSTGGSASRRDDLTGENLVAPE